MAEQRITFRFGYEGPRVRLDILVGNPNVPEEVVTAFFPPAQADAMAAQFQQWAKNVRQWEGIEGAARVDAVVNINVQNLLPAAGRTG